MWDVERQINTQPTAGAAAAAVANAFLYAAAAVAAAAAFCRGWDRDRRRPS